MKDLHFSLMRELNNSFLNKSLTREQTLKGYIKSLLNDYKGIRNKHPESKTRKWMLENGHASLYAQAIVIMTWSSFKVRAGFDDGDENKRHYGKRIFTREELINYLTINNLDSARKLANFRKSKEPAVYDYKKEFGSWKKAKEESFGEIFTDEIRCDRELLIKVVIENNLWTWRRYLEAREKTPDIIPSTNQIKNIFNSFSGLTDASLAALAQEKHPSEN